MAFGGKSWPINPVDFSQQISTGSDPLCQGAIFDLSLGTDNVGPGPDWIVGDTFLVRNISQLHSSCPSPFFLEKCIHGLPFNTSVCWVCPVVYCGWWIRCGILWAGLGLIHILTSTTTAGTATAGSSNPTKSGMCPIFCRPVLFFLCFPDQVPCQPQSLHS